MRLALLALKNVSNVNSFEEALELRLIQGNPGTLYLRLVDLDRPTKDGSYLRFVPLSGSSLQLTFQEIDLNNVVTKICAQPFSADDRSIWSADIMAGDKLYLNNIDALLTMGGIDYNVPIISSIVSDGSGQNRFYC